MKILIKNGRIVDPKNKIDSKLNIVLEKGKISKIIAEEEDADEVIDAANCIISPGFVDMHMHEDPYLREEEKFDIGIFESMVKMGATTVVGGNCGVGPYDLKEYLDAADNIGTPSNVGMLIPHESLRKFVDENDKYKKIKDESKLNLMKERAEYFLDEGCLGISFGIRYIPGLENNELITISSSVKNRDKIIAAHIRDDAKNVIKATEELLFIGKELGVKIQNSHIGSMGAYGQMEELLILMDLSRKNGLDLGFDCYPYSAFSTGIGETTYDEGFLDRYQIDYDKIEVAEGEFAGKRLNEKLFKKLRKEKPETITIGHVMKEEEVKMALSHPNTIVASDGFMHNKQGHPRASGTFPRFLSRYVRDEKIVDLHTGLSKMTWMPAERLGIDKGTLGIGKDADIVIFNLNELEDKATFKNPFEAPEGIKYVIVNGEISVKNNKLIKDNLGKAVRK